MTMHLEIDIELTVNTLVNDKHYLIAVTTNVLSLQ